MYSYYLDLTSLGISAPLCCSGVVPSAELTIVANVAIATGPAVSFNNSYLLHCKEVSILLNLPEAVG